MMINVSNSLVFLRFYPDTLRGSGGHVPPPRPGVARCAEARMRHQDSYPEILLPQEIISLQNATVKHCVKLRTQRSYRENNQRVVLVGADVVRELAVVLDLLALFYVKGSDPPQLPVPSRAIAVTEDVMAKITGLETVSPETFAAEAALPQPADFMAWTPDRLQRLLVLERCQDPGNLGTLLRTSVAMGWDGVFLLPGCADPFNEKSMRASRGACFKIPIQQGAIGDLIDVADMHHLPRIVADVEPSADRLFMADDGPTGDNHLVFSSSLKSLQSAKACLILGSEGQGVSAEVRKHCHPVSIPMLGDMESLNVASAGAILMWLLSGRAPTLVSDLARATNPAEESSQ